MKLPVPVKGSGATLSPMPCAAPLPCGRVRSQAKPARRPYDKSDATAGSGPCPGRPPVSHINTTSASARTARREGLRVSRARVSVEGVDEDRQGGHFQPAEVMHIS